MKDSRVPLALAALALFAGGFGLGWMVRGERSGPSDFAGSSGSVQVTDSTLTNLGAAADGGMLRGSVLDGSVQTVASAEVTDNPGHGREGQVVVAGSIDPNARLARGSAPGDDDSSPAEPATGTDGGVRGQLDATAIRDVMREHHDELGFCFAWQLHSNPNLGGRLIMEFEIAGDGTVSEAQIVDDALGDETVARCFVNVTRRMEFPAPEGDGTVTVRYPFTLSSESDDDE